MLQRVVSGSFQLVDQAWVLLLLVILLSHFCPLAGWVGGFLTNKMETDVYVDGLKVEIKLTPRGGVRNEVPQNVDCGIVPDTRKTTLCIYDYEIPRSNEVYYPESGCPTGKSRVETNKES